jgi:hypothetical protein
MNINELPFIAVHLWQSSLIQGLSRLPWLGLQYCKAAVPNPWPAGQKWPAKPKKVARQASKWPSSLKQLTKIYEKFDTFDRIEHCEHIIIFYYKLLYFDVYK